MYTIPGTIVAGGLPQSIFCTAPLAFLIVGNRAGLIGHGKGKSNDAKKAVERAYTNAMSNLIAIELFDGHTIPHDVEHRFKKTKVNLYSGKQGTGVIANELVSTICNLAGIQNLTAKVHGVQNIDCYKYETKSWA